MESTVVPHDASEDVHVPGEHEGQPDGWNHVVHRAVRVAPHCTALHYAPGDLLDDRAIAPSLQPCVSQVTSLMIEPDYDLKKVKGDSRRKSAVLAPEREVFSDRPEEDVV
eukprot:scaffold78324_cov48-Phaeocystis_antarctica.AAC.1